MNKAISTDNLNWSRPMLVEEIRSQRSLIPSCSGVYVFTNYPGPLRANLGVLYVGMAKTLSNRLPSYLSDPGKVRLFRRGDSREISTSLKHAGKVQLLMKINQKMLYSPTSGIYLRWTINQDYKALETALIKQLQPAYNTQGKS